MQPFMDGLESRSGRLTLQEAMAERPKRALVVRGLPTGSQDLDALTGGLQPGQLWVVTGRSGAGKSVFTLGLARNAAIRRRARTVLLSARGSHVDTVTMLLSAEARVPVHHLRMGGLDDSDWARLARGMGEVAEAPLLLFTADTGPAEPRPSGAQRVLQAQDATARYDLGLLIVDDVPASVTVEELSALKALAISSSLPVVVVLDEDATRPLRKLERATGLVADLVMRIDRDHERASRKQSARAGEADLRVLRHRHGPITVITLAFQGHYARFAELPMGDTVGRSA